MSAEATCRCICHAFGDERLYCEHRGCCNAWAKGYRDASEDSRAIAGICMTCGVTVSHRPGKPGEYDHTCPSRSRAPSPPETPAAEGSELAKIERLLNEYGLSMYEEGRHRGRDEGSDRKRKAVLSAIRSCAASPASAPTDPATKEQS